MMRLWVGQNKGCLTRVWHSLWSWLKLMRSPRAAVVIRTGIEIKPKVRCPFQTVVAMQKLLYKSFPGSLCLESQPFPKLVPICKISWRLGGKQGESWVGHVHVAKGLAGHRFCPSLLVLFLANTNCHSERSKPAPARRSACECEESLFNPANDAGCRIRRFCVCGRVKFV